MKKLIILAALSLFAATTAFADTTLTLSTTDTGKSLWGAKTGGTAVSGTNLIGKTSTGVGVGLFAAATGYAAVTQHKNGTKAFGSSFDSTAIYSIPVTTVGTAITGPSAADSAMFLTGNWTTM